MIPVWLDEPARVESYGSITSQTLRFAAGALDDTRSVTLGVPEMWTVSLNVGVAYNNRCVDCSALAAPLPLIETSSTSLSVPATALPSDRRATPFPPDVGRRTTGMEPGTGNDANGVGGMTPPRPRPRPRPRATNAAAAAESPPRPPFVDASANSAAAA